MTRLSSVLTPRRLAFDGLLLLPASFYLYRIERFPGADNDEASLLDISYRFATFGDAKYPVLYAESFNSDAVRKYPPPLAFWMRNLFHYAVGFSPRSSRVFSATLVIALVAIATGVAGRVFASRWLLPVVPLAIGFHPRILVAARSVRFEQEVCFLGLLAVLGIPLMLKPSGRGRSILWILSGLTAGWAAGSHPWGVVFPAVLFLSLIAHRKAWSELDGLTARRRLGCWMAGLAVPVVLTAAPILADLENYRACARATKACYEIRDAQNTEWMSAQYPRLAQHLPARFVAHLFELELSAFYSPTPRRYTSFFVGLFFLQVFVVAAAAGSLFVGPRGADVLLHVCLWLACGFLAFLFYYNPSENYYLYPALTVPLAFALLAFRLLRGVQGWRRRVPRWLPMTILVAAAAGAVHFSILEARRIGAQGRPVSLDERFDAIAEMGRRLSWNTETRPIYCDMITWIAGGRRQKNIYEKAGWVPGETPRDVGGAVFRSHLMEALLRLPNMGDVQISPDEKAERLAALLEPTALSGILFDEASEYYFYTPTDRAAAPLEVGILQPECRQTWMTAAATPAEGRGDAEGTSWSSLSKGAHLLLIGGNGGVGGPFTLSVEGADGRPIGAPREVALHFLYRRVRKALLVEVPEDGASVRVVLSGAGGSTFLSESATLLRLMPSNR